MRTLRPHATVVPLFLGVAVSKQFFFVGASLVMCLPMPQFMHEFARNQAAVAEIGHRAWGVGDGLPRRSITPVPSKHEKARLF